MPEASCPEEIQHKSITGISHSMSPLVSSGEGGGEGGRDGGEGGRVWVGGGRGKEGGCWFRSSCSCGVTSE